MGSKYVPILTNSISGLSTTTEGQIRKMLDCLTAALSQTTSDEQKLRQKVESQLRKTRLDKHKEVTGDDGSIPEDLQSEDATDLNEVDYPVIIINGFISKENVKGDMIYHMLVEVCCDILKTPVERIEFNGY